MKKLFLICLLISLPVHASELDRLNEYVAKEKGVKELPLPHIVYAPAKLQNYLGDGVNRIAAYKHSNRTIYTSDRTKDYHLVHELTHYYQYMYKEHVCKEQDALTVQFDYCETRDCPVHDKEFIKSRGC